MSKIVRCNHKIVSSGSHSSEKVEIANSCYLVNTHEFNKSLVKFTIVECNNSLCDSNNDCR